MTTTQWVLAVVIPLVLWRVYRRVRRFVGRQRSHLWRHWLAVIFFPLAIALLSLVALHDMTAFSCLAAGTATGVGLAIWGLKLTRFERTDTGFYYTPSAHIGIAVALVFVARVLYRLVEIYAAGGLARGGPQDFARSPLTLLAFGLLAGYYAAYASGILRWRLAAPAMIPQPPPEPGP